MDAVVFWTASAGLGAGGYLDIGRQCGRIDAAVVANRPERVLDAGAVCRLVGVCNVLERGSGLVEWLEDMMSISMASEHRSVQCVQLHLKCGTYLAFCM